MSKKQTELPSNPTNTDLYFSIRNDLLRINTELNEKINDMERKNNERYASMILKIIGALIAVVGGVHGISFAVDHLLS